MTNRTAVHRTLAASVLALAVGGSLVACNGTSTQETPTTTKNVMKPCPPPNGAPLPPGMQPPPGGFAKEGEPCIEPQQGGPDTGAGQGAYPPPAGGGQNGPRSAQDGQGAYPPPPQGGQQGGQGAYPPPPRQGSGQGAYPPPPQGGQGAYPPPPQGRQGAGNQLPPPADAPQR